MSKEVSPALTGLISEFIINTLFDTNKADKIYDLVDKISLTAHKDAEEHLTNGNFEEAAKEFMLASKALKKGASRVDKDVSGTLIDVALEWQRQAEQALYAEVTFYTNKALKYKKLGDNEKSTEWMNKAKTLEHQIKTGFLNEKIDDEVSTLYQRIRVDAYAVRGRKIGEKVVAAIGSLFGRKSEEPLPTEEALPKKELGEVAEVRVTPEQITIKNDFTEIKEKWYEWSVYLVAEENIMKQIESVTYTLHPTFPEPIQTVKDPASGFRLNSSGWGEFQIKADINLKNGETISLYHWLTLGERAPKK